MRIPLIAANWKMNTTIAEAVDLVKTMLPNLHVVTEIEKVLCPPFISLNALTELIKGSSVKLGAQNVYYQMKGAFTGEISPVMLRGICDFIIVGHSERRQYFGETDEIINKKIKAVQELNFTPILCIGESLRSRENGQTETIIRNQIHNCLAGVNATRNIVIAYEPIWAIGTGKAATSEQANQTCKLIRHTLSEIWHSDAADAIRILYGGSVTPDNIADLISQTDIDGALVGGASLKANDFVEIVRKTASIHRNL